MLLNNSWTAKAKEKWFIMSGKCSMIGFGTGITPEKKQNACS
jgi:hypothetical protein